MAKKENRDVSRVLVENFVSLQRVMTNLSLKFDNLATQISKLLELFEISAKTIAEKNPQNASRYTDQSGRELMGKIDSLLEQNKVIARGLTLIHETSPQGPREIREISQESQRRPQMPQFQVPRKAVRQIEQSPARRQARTDGYQKSISDSKNEQSKQS